MDGARPTRRDVQTAAIAATVDGLLFSDVLLPTRADLHTPAWISLAWAAIGGVLLLGRRRWPLPVLIALCLHSAIAALLMTFRPVVAVCVALVSVATRCSRPRVLAGFAACVATALTWVVNDARTSPIVTAPKMVGLGVFYLVALAGVVGIGVWARAGLLERRRLERRGAAEARLAVALERRRMARELHDIVGHTVTIMMLQAAGARRLMSADPARADAALGAVDEMGNQAMGELRRLLAVLRSTDPDPDASEGDPADRPGLANLADLLAAVRTVGVEVELVQHGTRDRLDPSVDLTGYRVIQEALTNVTKHAGDGAPVTVRIDWGETDLIIVVENGPPAPAARPFGPPGGSGLAGLSERVALVGGTLQASKQPSGGFRVAATLPCAARGPR